MESVTEVKTGTEPKIVPLPIPAISDTKNTIGGIDKNLLKKYGFYALIIVIIIIVIYAIWRVKESYLTESIRSDSDREGWDLRKSIHDYLKLQDDELRKFSSNT